jgi:hypothetical protein
MKSASPPVQRKTTTAGLSAVRKPAETARRVERFMAEHPVTAHV